MVEPGRKTPIPQRIALKIAPWIPQPLLAYPERVVINLAAIAIGISAFWPPPGGVAEAWPDWFRYEWSIGLILGGGAALHGTWTGYRPSERLGAALFAVCAAIYAASAGVLFGLMATATVVIWSCLTMAKLIRLIRSLAVSAQITNAIREHRNATGQNHAVQSEWQQEGPEGSAGN